MASITRTDTTDTAAEAEPRGYHSAVEIDEDVGSWKDWVGPALAILFVVLAIAGLGLTAGGYL